MSFYLTRPYRKKPSGFVEPNLAHPILRDLVLWFPALEPTGALIRDFSKYSHHGFINSFGYGIKNRRAFFNNTYVPGGQISVPHTPILEGAADSPFTLSIWMHSFVSSGNRGLIFKGRTSPYRYSMGTNVRDLAYFIPGSGWTRSNQSWNINEWWHLATVFDGVNAHLYLNAQLDKTFALNTQETTSELIIGGFANSDTTVRGYLEDVRIYNRALSPFEIAMLADDTARWEPFERRIWVPPTEAAPPGPITGTGALQAQDASVTGVGDVIGPTVITGTGALQAQDTAVVGVGDVTSPSVGTGTLQAQAAQVFGVGAVVHDGSGALQAQSADVVGVGEVGNVRTGAGALQAGEAVVVGTGIRVSVGSGALQAQDAAVSGAGVVEGLTSGTGVLQAQEAAVAGTGHLIRVGSGALQAQPAQVAGVGAILGELTLSPADIAAIADAVYAKLVSEGLVQQINEVWQRRGLDPANPQTYDKAGNEIRVGNITIDLSGDPSSVTQTRQP